MAYWDHRANMVWHYPARRVKNGWYEIDCGCSGGLQWGGDEPRECNRCDGSGRIHWHKKSKVFALYPGGILLGKGKLTKLELKGNLNRKARYEI